MKRRNNNNNNFKPYNNNNRFNKFLSKVNPLLNEQLTTSIDRVSNIFEKNKSLVFEDFKTKDFETNQFLLNKIFNPLIKKPFNMVLIRDSIKGVLEYGSNKNKEYEALEKLEFNNINFFEGKPINEVLIEKGEILVKLYDLIITLKTLYVRNQDKGIIKLLKENHTFPTEEIIQNLETVFGNLVYPLIMIDNCEFQNFYDNEKFFLNLIGGSSKSIENEPLTDGSLTDDFQDKVFNEVDILIKLLNDDNNNLNKNEKYENNLLIQKIKKKVLTIFYYGFPKSGKSLYINYHMNKILKYITKKYKEENIKKKEENKNKNKNKNKNFNEISVDDIFILRMRATEIEQIRSMYKNISDLTFSALIIDYIIRRYITSKKNLILLYIEGIEKFILCPKGIKKCSENLNQNILNSLLTIFSQLEESNNFILFFDSSEPKTILDLYPMFFEKVVFLRHVMPPNITMISEFFNKYMESYLPKYVCNYKTVDTKSVFKYKNNNNNNEKNLEIEKLQNNDASNSLIYSIFNKYYIFNEILETINNFKLLKQIEIKNTFDFLENSDKFQNEILIYLDFTQQTISKKTNVDISKKTNVDKCFHIYPEFNFYKKIFVGLFLVDIDSYKDYLNLNNNKKSTSKDKKEAFEKIWTQFDPSYGKKEDLNKIFDIFNENKDENKDKNDFYLRINFLKNIKNDEGKFQNIYKYFMKGNILKIESDETNLMTILTDDEFYSKYFDIEELENKFMEKNSLFLFNLTEISAVNLLNFIKSVSKKVTDKLNIDTVQKLTENVTENVDSQSFVNKIINKLKPETDINPFEN